MRLSNDLSTWGLPEPVKTEAKKLVEVKERTSEILEEIDRRLNRIMDGLHEAKGVDIRVDQEVAGKIEMSIRIQGHVDPDDLLSVENRVKSQIDAALHGSDFSVSDVLVAERDGSLVVDIILKFDHSFLDIDAIGAAVIDGLRV